MWTALWENVDQEVIEALTITGKGDFKILPKDQLEAIYIDRFLAYKGDTLRNRFFIILEDNMNIVYSIKKMKEWLVKLTDHLNWAKVTKSVQNSDAVGLSSSVGSSTSVGSDKNISVAYAKGDNKADVNQTTKAGATDSNSNANEAVTKEFIEVNKDPEKNKYSPMRSFSASNTVGDNAIIDIGLQLNNMISNSTATATSNNTGLSKNTNKADTTILNFSTAQDLISIINIKIPELRKVFYSKFESLFIAIY